MEPTYRIAQHLRERRAKARLCSYGEHLKPFNKRCSLIDAIEECADQLVYLLNMAQESRRLMIDLMANSVRLREAGHTAAAGGLDKMIVGMGGKEALAQYDEILGGGTVAEDATVDARDEALRVAEEALRQVVTASINAGFSEKQGQLNTVCRTALAAIRAAGGAR